MARTGRPKGERQAVKSTFIRLSDDELELIEGFLEQQARSVIGGEKITIAAFGRELMLREAIKALIRDFLANYRPEQVFAVEAVMHAFDLTAPMKRVTLAVLRDLVSRKELVENSPTSFSRPKQR